MDSYYRPRLERTRHREEEKLNKINVNATFPVFNFLTTLLKLNLYLSDLYTKIFRIYQFYILNVHNGFSVGAITIVIPVIELTDLIMSLVLTSYTFLSGYTLRLFISPVQDYESQHLPHKNASIDVLDFH